MTRLKLIMVATTIDGAHDDVFHWVLTTIGALWCFLNAFNCALW